MKILRAALHFTFLAFTAMLPLQFTHMAGIPAIPASYWFDFPSILFSAWSPFLFACCAGILLCLFLLETLANRCALSFRGGVLLWSLWLLFALTGAAGLWNASCTDTARQILTYLIGLAAFAGCVFLFLNCGKDAARMLAGALLTGAVLAALSGLYQYFSGLDELRSYVAEKGLAPGFSPALLRQMTSDRLFGPFSVSNLYGGYLAAFLIPAVLLVWHWAGRHVTPARLAQFLLAAFVFFLFAFPLWHTGSRGALLALFAGALAVFLPWAVARGWFRGWKMLLSLGGILCISTGFLLVVHLGRGFGSMIFRLDYDFAALKMMLLHPFAGTGLGDFFHDYPRLKLLLNDEYPHFPHNLVLFSGAQCGVFGFLAALSLLLFPLFTGLKTLVWRLKNTPRAEDPGVLRLCGILAFFTVLSADSLMETVIGSPAFAGALIAGGFLVLREAFPADSPEKITVSTQPRILRGGLCTLLFLTALSALFSAVPAMRREAAYACLFETADPRFSRTGSGGNTIDPEQVEKAFQAARLAAPDSPFVFQTAARFYASRGDFVRAEALISESVRLSPEDSGFLRTRALYRLKGLNGIPDGAVRADLTEARRLSPRDPLLEKLVTEIVSPNAPKAIPEVFQRRAAGCPGAGEVPAGD